jgi:hypothetical protein
MQNLVYFPNGRFCMEAIRRIGHDPGGLEAVKIIPATLCARPVTRRKCRCFVEKEKLGVQIWRHNYAVTPFKFQPAGYPGF